MTTVSVAIPTLNGAGVLEQTITAVRAQRLD
jgi:glycosyltransferase involved in cell wall biosynthesis